MTSWQILSDNFSLTMVTARRSIENSIYRPSIPNNNTESFTSDGNLEIISPENKNKFLKAIFFCFLLRNKNKFLNKTT